MVCCWFHINNHMWQIYLGQNGKVIYTPGFLFHFRGCDGLDRLDSSLFFNAPMYFNCGIMVWTLESFCGLGHSAQPRLRRTWVTLLGHRSNSQHQDHHNLGRLHPWTFTGGKSHLQSVSTISGQTIFVDPLFLGWWLFPFVGFVPNVANYTWTTLLDAHDVANCKLPASLSKTNWKKIVQNPFLRSRS